MKRSAYIVLLGLATGCFLGAPEEDASAPPPEPLPPPLVDPGGDLQDDAVTGAPPIEPPLPTSPLAFADASSGHLHADAVRAAAHPAWVHQADDPSGLYDRSGSTEVSSVDDGMLVCRVTLLGGQFDDGLFAGGADIYLQLALAGGHTRHTLQTASRTYTFPVHELARNDTIAATVMDDDVFSDDRVGSGRAPFSGRETVIDAGGAHVRCRPVDPAVVRAGRERGLRRLSAAVDRLGTPRPELLRAELGYPTRDAAAVLAAIPAALAWSERGNDEASAILERATAFEDDWEDALASAVDAAVQGLPPVGTGVELARTGTVSLSEPVCDEAAQTLLRERAPTAATTSCLATLSVEAGAAGELAWQGDEALTLVAIGMRGSGTPLRTLAVRRGAAPVPEGASVRFTRGEQLELLVELPRGETAPLLRAQRRRQTVLLRTE